MGKVIRSLLEFDDEDEEVCLLAIYSSVEIFRLVFHINKALDIQLKRTPNDVRLFNKNDSVSHFVLYHFDDPINYLDYYFIPNMALSKSLQKSTDRSLFEDDNYFHSYLVPERKTVDYFLKIEGSETCGELVGELNKIKLIAAVRTVEINTLKSYKNLIFN